MKLYNLIFYSIAAVSRYHAPHVQMGKNDQPMYNSNKEN